MLPGFLLHGRTTAASCLRAGPSVLGAPAGEGAPAQLGAVVQEKCVLGTGKGLPVLAFMLLWELGHLERSCPPRSCWGHRSPWTGASLVSQRCAPGAFGTSPLPVWVTRHPHPSSGLPPAGETATGWLRCLPETRGQQRWPWTDPAGGRAGRAGVS